MTKLAIVYKTKGDRNTYSAGGLAANAMHSAAVLGEMGIFIRLVPVESFDELRSALTHYPYTHVIVEAVWLTLQQLLELHRLYPNTHFVVRAHSKMGFLQVEPEAIAIMREILDLSLSRISLASNNHEFAESLTEVYGPSRCLYLPNLYDLASAPPRNYQRGPLRIASFGASRLLKLHPSAALAALQITKRLGRALDFYVNVDRTPGGESVRRSVRNLFYQLPRAKLIEVGWQDPNVFRQTIATMDLVIQLSCTETFCLVAADAVSSGVPVVAGPAISWLPANLLVGDVDDTSAVATQGVQILTGAWLATRAQRRALAKYTAKAEKIWLKYLEQYRRCL